MKRLEDFQKEYMIFVRGGKYKKKVFNLEVCKYPVTQFMWENIMGYNPSRFKGANKPVEIVNWWEVLKFCNKLSEKYNLKPVYDLSQEEKGILKIIHLDGEIVEEDKSDFKKTEGFRLPTEAEWEWFARGGQKAIDEGTFDYKYSGSNNIDEVAWYYENSGAKNEEGTTQNVGLKEANQLGLYDCSGNVWEWCYDMSDDESIEDGIVYRKLKGGAWISNLELCQNFFCTSENAIFEDIDIGFRIVRTIH